MKPDHELVRGLGPIAAISVNVGNIIGTGIFLKARVMTCNVGTPFRVILVWVAAGLLALAGALTYAELTTMRPHAGAEYVITRDAYGKVWAFLNGWSQMLISRTASAAAGVHDQDGLSGRRDVTAGRLGRRRLRVAVAAANPAAASVSPTTPARTLDRLAFASNVTATSRRHDVARPWTAATTAHAAGRSAQTACLSTVPRPRRTREPPAASGEAGQSSTGPKGRVGC